MCADDDDDDDTVAAALAAAAATSCHMRYRGGVDGKDAVVDDISGSSGKTVSGGCNREGRRKTATPVPSVVVLAAATAVVVFVGVVGDDMNACSTGIET